MSASGRRILEQSLREMRLERLIHALDYAPGMDDLTMDEWEAIAKHTKGLQDATGQALEWLISMESEDKLRRCKWVVACRSLTGRLSVCKGNDGRELVFETREQAMEHAESCRLIVGSADYWVESVLDWDDVHRLSKI